MQCVKHLGSEGHARRDSQVRYRDRRKNPGSHWQQTGSQGYPCREPVRHHFFKWRAKGISWRKDRRTQYAPEEYGITECAWKGPKGQVVLAIQESSSKGIVKEEIMGMALWDLLKRRTRRVTSLAMAQWRSHHFSRIGRTGIARPRRRLGGVVNSANVQEQGECTCTLLFDHTFEVR
jgi:hypothetical protein